MVNWFRRVRERVVVPTVKPRQDTSSAANVNRVTLAELTPDLDTYLGQAAYLQLSLFETLSNAVSTAPTTDAKEMISRVASISLAKHHGLVAEIELQGLPAGQLMAPFAERIDGFYHVTQGHDWYELLISSYVTSGILDDFFIRLAAGLPDESAARIMATLSDDKGLRLIVNELRDAINANPKLASRLAMWGRRLVGDTLLVARSALVVPALSAPDEARLEPIFTELIAAHTRRMDALGLTA